VTENAHPRAQAPISPVVHRSVQRTLGWPHLVLIVFQPTLDRSKEYAGHYGSGPTPRPYECDSILVLSYHTFHRNMKASHPPKGLSSPSFATFSTSCTATTDSSAIWGPGGLSGRAIEAFGDATLRGIENIIIRRKLATYRALFPHMDDTPIRNIDSIYENILELSRYFIHTAEWMADIQKSNRSTT
jgi:hypothetical protein